MGEVPHPRPGLRGKTRGVRFKTGASFEAAPVSGSYDLSPCALDCSALHTGEISHPLSDSAHSSMASGSRKPLRPGAVVDRNQWGFASCASTTRVTWRRWTVALSLLPLSKSVLENSDSKWTLTGHGSRHVLQEFGRTVSCSSAPRCGRRSQTC
jgi:hypothetical protein